MDRQQKESMVGGLKDKLSRITSIVLADYRGITVPTVTQMRDEFRAQGCEYKVLKNSLVEIAIRGTAVEGITKLLKGPTALIWSYEDPISPAKIATKWAKESSKFIIKGGYIEGQVLDPHGVESLAKMPGKEEIRASLLATFLSVPQTYMQTLLAAPQNFVYLLDAKVKV